MSLKLVIVALVASFAIHYAVGAPHLNDANDVEDLSKKFMEFLREDREFHGLLDQPRLVVNDVLRYKRQAKDAIDIDNIDMGDDQAKQPGFFDRAAKFVMEVLQRFLKWINTDE